MGKTDPIIPLRGCIGSLLGNNEKDRMDHKVIESILIKAFTDRHFTDYSHLIKVKWTGKSIDTYANIR